MLTIRELQKTYPSGVQALRDVSLDIEPGMFGLLGPNGAGKTTLMKILATLLDPDSGSAAMSGVDLINRQATHASDAWLFAAGVWILPNAHRRTDASIILPN